MTIPKQVFHGRWWAPDGVRRFRDFAYMGTLIIEEDGTSRLEIYHDQRISAVFNVYERYEIIWGESADGIKITLFNAVSLHNIKKNEFFEEVFKLSAVVIGEHIKTGGEPLFDRCIVRYKYLRNWVLKYKIPPYNIDTSGDIRKNNTPLIHTSIEEDIGLYIFHHLDYSENQYGFNAAETAMLTFTSVNLTSVSRFVDLVREYSSFLSFALFSDQHPSEIILMKNGDNHFCRVYHKMGKSTNPYDYSLIPVLHFHAKLPAILKIWHQKYGQLSQICHYLLSILDYDEFDIPDFLIIAQALDGYHKRFMNKKDGKDIRKYKDQIDAMLDWFDDVESIRECHIDSKMMADTRNKYSHLVPDEEDEGKTIARGAELFSLTQKAKILLTACILDLLGLNHKEIEICFNSSIWCSVIDNIHFEESE